MPAKSKSQQRAAGMALSAKRGDMPVSDLQGAAKEMYDSMTEKELEDFAETEHKGLPDKVESSRQKERMFRGLIQKEIKEVLREIKRNR